MILRYFWSVCNNLSTFPLFSQMLKIIFLVTYFAMILRYFWSVCNNLSTFSLFSQMLTLGILIHHLLLLITQLLKLPCEEVVLRRVISLLMINRSIPLTALLQQGFTPREKRRVLSLCCRLCRILLIPFQLHKGTPSIPYQLHVGAEQLIVITVEIIRAHRWLHRALRPSKLTFLFTTNRALACQAGGRELLHAAVEGHHVLFGRRLFSDTTFICLKIFLSLFSKDHGVDEAGLPAQRLPKVDPLRFCTLQRSRGASASPTKQSLPMAR